MFKRLFGQRKYLAALTAVILVIQSILPISWLGVNVAQADVAQKWEFNNAADYLLDTNISIFDYDGTGDGVAHFYTTWSSGGYGTNLPAGNLIERMEYASDGTVWATMRVGGLAYKSVDGGVTWAAAGTGVINNRQIVEITPGPSAFADLLAVGDNGGGIPMASYSNDGGANWIPAIIVLAAGGTGWMSVTWDLANTKAYAVDTGGRTYVSADNGHNWAQTAALTAISVTTDIVCTSSNTIAIIGYDSAVPATGRLAYTTNAGAAWAMATLPGSPIVLRTTTYVGGWLYVGGGEGVMAGVIYAANINLGGGGSFANPADWTDISAAMGAGTAVLDFESYQSIPFAAVSTAGDPVNIISTLDNGAHWLSHASTTDTGGPVSNAALVDTGTVLLLGANAAAAQADVWKATVEAADTSMVTKAGITDVQDITSVAAEYHALNTGAIKIAFGLTSAEGAGPTWHYYDTGTSSWKTSVADDPNFATALGDLTPLVLADLPLAPTSSGQTIYVKIYPTGTAPILDSFTVGYTSLEGGGGPGEGTDPADKTPPVSQVNPLPRYSTAPDVCNPVLHIEATASDDKLLYAVTLYISTNGTDFAPWNGDSGTDYYAPYAWDVDVGDGETYYFYSIAIDNGNPRNYEAPPGGQDWDTMTTVDVKAPTVSDSTPRDLDTNVGVGQPIIFTFSESLVPETFTYDFYQETSSGNAPVTGAVLTWENNYTKIVVTHPALEYSADYVFNITNATDPAGNQLNNVVSCDPPWLPPGCDRWYYPWERGHPRQCYRAIPQLPAPKRIHFMTQTRMDPDLLDSTFTVPDGNNTDGSYNAGDEAQFTLTLINKSNVPASNVAAKIDIPILLVTYQQTDSNGGGNMVEHKDEHSRVTQLEWRNVQPIVKDQPVVVKFTVKINVPATVFDVSLTAKIYDNVNFPEEPDTPITRNATLKIERNPQFVTSSKTVDKALAQLGDVLTYAITIINNGTTIGDVELSDFVPNESNTGAQPPIFFKPGSVTYNENETRWETAPYYDTATQTIWAVARGVMPNSGSLTLGFQAVVRGNITGEVDVVNKAYVWDPNIEPSQKVELTASTHVPGGPKAPLQIVYQMPAPDSDNNALKQSIKIGFNKSVKIEDPNMPFAYELKESDRKLGEEELTEWKPAWSDFNGLTNTMFTLTPPSGELAVGAIYEVTVVSAYDATDGEKLKDAPVTWEFTTADPMVRITQPTDPLYELVVNTLSDRFEVKLIDAISGEDYLAEENIGIGLRAYLGGEPRGSGSFWASASQPLGNQSPKVTIKKGASSTGFYYQDTLASSPDYLTIRAFEDPYRGWPDDEKYVEVVDSEQPAESLILSAPKTVGAGQLSQPITVRATDENGSLRSLPEGKLYLYADSTSGAFYDSQYRKLPLISDQGSTYDLMVQDVAPQYVDINGNVALLTLYYLNNQVGIDKITVSDNSPQLPDINLNDASAILNIQEILIDIEKELEEVDDDTGRIIDKIKVDPTEVTLLPDSQQNFTATAYDTKGKKISGLKFGWFVLVDKSGTIEKKGHADSHVSTFTASKNLGTYYDTVLVAALYNNKLAYTTASVRIVDVANYRGPKRLPVTGINGLQIILMGLTLAAAVALAWVEHYDKTHFRSEGNR